MYSLESKLFEHVISISYGQTEKGSMEIKFK